MAVDGRPCSAPGLGPVPPPRVDPGGDGSASWATSRRSTRSGRFEGMLGEVGMAAMWVVRGRSDVSVAGRDSRVTSQVQGVTDRP